MNFDELNEYYNKNMNQTQAQINNLATEKQNAINDYETNYQNQLNEYNTLQEQQQNYIDTWAATQKEQQQKQTDYNIGLIEQNKKEAAEETQKQTQDAYVDYMKQTNQYGGALENLAARGLATQGYSESSVVAMYNTYQNRVATANAALTKANTEYDNQIQQALLTNDAALAEFALEQMKQSYQLALDGFDFRNNLYNQRLSYMQDIEDTYYNRGLQLQSLQNTYAGELGKIKQYQDEIQMEREKRALAKEQWEREFAEQQRQFDAQLRRSYSTSGGSGGSGDTYNWVNGSSNDKQTSKYDLVTDYWQGEYNKDALTNGKVDPNKVLSNGYQPNNINGKPLVKTGYTIDKIGKTISGKTKTITQNIWQTSDGKNYYWDGNNNQYVEYKGENVPYVVTAEEIDRLQKILNS